MYNLCRTGRNLNMSPKPSRITLTIGRSSDGPRSTGDFNVLGLGFAFYQMWLYMAIFSAPKTFHPDTLLSISFAFPQSHHALLVYTFLISSAIFLIGFSIFSKKLTSFFQSKACIFISCMLVFLGTALLFLSALGAPIIFIASLCMGIGTAFQIILFGIIFSGYDFATCVLNAGVAFAVGFIGADALTNWVPSPISGICACLMPILTLLLFLRYGITLKTQTDGEVSISYVREYITRLAISMVFLGFVVGSMRVVCGDKLLSSGDITMELVLGVGCMVSALVLIFAIALSKRTELWDSLFRNVTPMIMLGFAGISLLASDAKIFAAFFAVIGFACLVSITWILLASFARNLNGSYIFVFGLGYGVIQAASVIGVAVANFLSQQALFASVASDVTPAQFASFTTELGLSELAIILMVAFSGAYATMPRYRELKEILASFMVVLSRELDKKRKDVVSDGVSEATEGSSDNAMMESARKRPPSENINGDGNAQIAAAHSDNADSEGLHFFSDSLDSQQDASDSSEMVKQQKDKKGSFIRRCDEISEEFRLSAREQEAFFFLAKGHNAAFLMEKLCISRSTAKTHINHIYKKLGIHTQQELLNMVEDRKRGPIGTNVDRATLQDAIRHANEDGPLDRDPSELIKHISQDLR